MEASNSQGVLAVPTERDEARCHFAPERRGASFDIRPKHNRKA